MLVLPPSDGLLWARPWLAIGFFLRRVRRAGKECWLHMRRSFCVMSAFLPASGGFRVAILGDVHGMWRGAAEAEVLERVVKPDLFVAVGDYGNEDAAFVEALVASTSCLSGARYFFLGNHDAWLSGKAGVASEALLRLKAACGELDCGYRRVEVPSATGVFSLVGARPLSWGGGIKSTNAKSWNLLSELYGVRNAEESLGVVTDALLGSVGPAIVVAHQGPAGLGDDRAAICGRDWTKRAADFGDDDLRDALDTARDGGAPVALCVFGHMHSALSGGGRRRMVHVDDRGTLHVNAAEVPRHRKNPAHGADDVHFTVVDVDDRGSPIRVLGVWLNEEAGLAAHDVLWARPAPPPAPS